MNAMQDEFPNDDDGAALALLAAEGVDLSVPRLIEFTIDAPDADVGERIGAALRDAGHEATLEFDEGEPGEGGDHDQEEFGPSWTVYVAVEMVPEYSALVDLQAELGRIAGPLGGDCDGWVTAVDGPDDTE